MSLNIVMLAGGSGTRLWPMSRTHLPKQLQKLIGDKTLIQQTFDRVEPLAPSSNIFVDTAAKYVNEIGQQLPKLPHANIIAEPKAKNTAAAIGLAAAHLYHRDKQAIMLSLPSDHAVTDVASFHTAIKTGVKVLESHPDYIVTVGIKPTRPSTELGYIQMDGEFATIDNQQVFKVKKFVEKPDTETAEQFFNSHHYLWNAAYFMWRVDMLLNLYQQFLPNTYQHLMAIEAAIGTPHYSKVLEEHYDQVDEIAVDYAILEKASNIVVIPADLGWDDIGHWGSLHDILMESSGEHLISQGEHIHHDTENSLIYAGDKMIATVGVRNLIVVDTPDVLFIADKSKAHEVKKLLDKLKEENKHHYL